MRLIIAGLMLITALAGDVVFGTTSSAHAQTITEYSLPADAGHPGGITVGPDGNLWFVTDRTVGRMTPEGLVTTFPVTVGLPVYDRDNQFAKRIATGADGNLWFTSYYSVVRVTPQGVMKEFPISTSSIRPQGITAGPDGNIWFTESSAKKVGRITPQGEITEFTVPGTYGRLYGITAAPDGNLWVTTSACTACIIGRITPSGVVTTYPVNTALSTPYEITASPDGSLWFTGNTSSAVFRLSSDGATLKEFPVPTTSAKANGIALGPDGNMWFTESYSSKIGRITSDGTITEYPLAAGSGPEIIVSGPGGSMWFAEAASGKIGKITVPPTSLRIGPVFSTVQTTARSVLRIYNTGKSASTVTIDLGDPGTGATLASWTSADIAAGTEKEFTIAEIESGALPAGFTKPPFYAVTVKTLMTGHLRHLLSRLSDGALSSLTACPVGTTTPKKDVAGVHSSLQSKNISQLIVHNTGLNARSVTLGVYDARNGNKRGSLQTALIPSKGATAVTVAALEAAVGVPADADMLRYIVKAEGAFSGYVQHLVQTPNGLTADLTPACYLQPEAPTSRADMVEYPIPTPNAVPSGIAIDGDNAMWFTESKSGKIGRITADGRITEYAVPGGLQDADGGVGPYGIATAADGNLYFTQSAPDPLAKITQSGSILGYPDYSRDYAFPAAGVTLASDGSVWLVEPTNDTIAKWDGTRYRRYQLPKPRLGAQLQSIVSGPDGNLWFTERSNVVGKIGKITPDGVITEFPIPQIFETGVATNFGTYGIAVGPDGNLWTTGTDYITRMTTAGVRTDFLIPSAGITPLSAGHPQARGIVRARDDNMWFSVYSAARIARITPQGKITDFPMSDTAARPDGIAAGSDGDLWVATAGTNAIVRLTLPIMGVHLSGLYSTEQTAQQSFVRVYNAGGAEGTVTIELSNANTGTVVGKWTTPKIPANSARQFSIAEIESTVGVNAVLRPFQYTAVVTADTTTTAGAAGAAATTTTFNGYVQHVLWRPSEGMLSNLSTCDEGASIALSQAFSVHSSLFQSNFPSVVTFMNVGYKAEPLTLLIYDAADGKKLGTYKVGTLAPQASVLLPVTAIEDGAGIRANTLYYTIKTQGSLLAHAQVVVNNLKAGFSVDMSTACIVN